MDKYTYLFLNLTLFLVLADEGKKLHFISPARRKSVLAPILNKIKIGADGADLGEKKLGSESSGSGHIAVQIEPARRVKVSKQDVLIFGDAD